MVETAQLLCPTSTSSVERLRVSAADSWLELVLSVASGLMVVNLEWTGRWWCEAGDGGSAAGRGCAGIRPPIRGNTATPGQRGWMIPRLAMAKLMNQWQYGKVLVSTSQLTRGVIAHWNITCSFTALLLHHYNYHPTNVWCLGH